MNGFGQWRDHLLSNKHRVNQQPLRTGADAEAWVVKMWRLWADWEKRRQEARGGGASLRAELEVQRGPTQGVAVTVSAAQHDLAVAVALKQHGLADEEAVQEARARVVWAESRQLRQQQQELALAAASTAVAQRSFKTALETALVERERALVERRAWRRQAKENAKAAAEARWAVAGAKAQAAAALVALAAVGPIVVD